MQNQNPSDNIQPASQANVPPTPGMSPPSPYPSYPPPSMPNEPAPAPYPYPSPSMPNGPAPAQYQPPSMPNGPVPAPYPYPSSSIPNGPAQHPYPSPYQQQYPPYAPAVGSTNNSIIKPSLIGGSIACGINVLITLLLTFVPAIGNATIPLYQFVPLLPSGMLSVGEFILSLIIALLCSPGFFVVGLQAIRKTGRMNSAMLACTLALVGFVVIDLILIIATAAYSFITTPSSSAFSILDLSEVSLLSWFADLIMASMVSL